LTNIKKEMLYRAKFFLGQLVILAMEMIFIKNMILVMRQNIDIKQ